MNLNKELGSVAEAVKKVMEAELSPKQKQIAKMAEPKHKIDAGDLAKLRAGHKPVKEDAEQVEEASYSAKAARAGKDIGKPGKMFAKIAAGAAKKYGSEERGKKVAGAVLAKLRMKEDEDLEITDEQVEELIEAFDHDEQNRMTFSEMIAAYKEHGLKVVAEEPTQDQYEKEIKDQIASASGKKKQPGVSTPTTQGVKAMPEEVEQIEELKKSTLGSYVKKAAKDQAGDAFEHGEDEHRQYGDPGEDPDRDKDIADRERRMANREKGIGRAVNRLTKEETHTKVEVYDFTDANGIKVSTIDLEEKTLTKPETKKKEEIVKSMKKKMPGFKERYGERAKSVIYATATKIAKEKA